MKLAAIWDMDGTLVDTAELHFAAWVEACRELARDFSRADFAATFGKRNPEILKMLFGPERFTPEEIAAIGIRKEDLYKAEARRGVELLPGVDSLMDSLHRRGFAQAVGTSAPRGNLELILELTGIGKYLGAGVAEQDTTRGKPHPEVFLNAAQRLGVEPSRCVVFEDAIYGIQAAKAGGMKAVGITFVGHHPAEALRAAGADVIVRSLEELNADEVIRLIEG
ncbi:MAG: HAD family phosphatase [Planctomycetia bacterium]|nr:HAD family phosphatase [Planctomycetia bacterium]